MKKEDKVMKEFLQEELEKESARIKKEVEQDLSLEEAGPHPELKNKIWKQVEELRRQREAYENLSEEDKEALRLGKELQLRREEKAKEEFSEELVPEPLELAVGAEESQLETQTTQEKQTKKVRVRKRRKKAVVAWAVALVAVLGVGITSFGDSGYAQKIFDQVVGARVMTQIDLEKDKEHSKSAENEEEKVFEQIKAAFGFDAVRLDYKPEKMKLVDSMVDQTLLIANIYYELNDQQITYTIIPGYRESSSGYDVEDQIVNEYIKEVDGIQIKVREYRIQDSEQLAFSAHFRYEEAEYILTGVIEREEFEKILGNLHFF